MVITKKLLLPKFELMPPSPSISMSSSMSTTGYDSDMLDISSQMNDSDGLDNRPKKKRVRTNLNHMSQEDKLNRRKLKNRVAAQSARDRKKAKMDDMESHAASLSQELMKLRREHEHLKRRNIQLEAENLDLKQQPTTTDRVNNSKVPQVKRDTDESVAFKSAALINASQQQKQGNLTRQDSLTPPEPVEEDAFPWMMPFVCWLVAIENLMKSSHGWRDALLSFLKENLTMAPPEVIEMIVKLISDKDLTDSSDDDHSLLPSQLQHLLRTSSPLGT
ncbi:X-box-binding protein 1 [Halotydeus destructor]|nr:X-box-binding protein 1 [Halotydeus destructor]